MRRFLHNWVITRLTLAALTITTPNLAFSTSPAGAITSTPPISASPQLTAPLIGGQPISSEASAILRGWIDSGSLSALKWPNFSDYRSDVQNFYAPANYSLAWVRDSHPTPQALALIAVLQDADSKGLSADDYDGPRWPDRIAQMQKASPSPSDADLAQFDLALTVCVMRYVSDLHVGKVNPKSLK